MTEQMMNDATAKLVVKQGPHPNREYTLTGSHTVIGRAHTSDIGITDPKVSRQHAQISRQGDTFAIQDLGSTNGTFVNGQRIDALTALNDGDSINLGETIRLTFEAIAVETEPPPPPEQQEFSAYTATPTIDEFSLAQDAASAIPEPIRPKSGRRRWLIVGLALLLLVFICAAAFFFLDSYDGGRLLYCGPLQPLLEAIFGAGSFAPTC